MSERERDKSDRTATEELSGDEGEQTIAKDIVVTKYNMAADIVNAVLKELISKCNADQSALELCDYGDQQLNERTSKVFKNKKDMKKGIAFPTCISVNNCVCHFSPLRSEADLKLTDGDVVKIDLGAHIDGFIAVAAHTVIVGASKDTKVTGRKADAILAAHYAMEAAIRMLKPGQYKNMDITDSIQKIAETYKCKPVENMLSHQLTRNKIDGAKQIIQNPGEKQRQDMEKCEFEQYEVYAIDVLISSGEGKARDMDNRTTIYKKNDEIVYQLKLKASRAFFSDADKRFGTMPFTLRAFDEEKKAKMGVVECEKHNLMKPFPVLFEREGEFVVQFKCTVLIMPTAIMKITGLNLDEDLYQSEHKIDDPKLLQIIQTSLKQGKKKTKKKADENNAVADRNGPAS
jgi:curved DNA binding protein